MTLREFNTHTPMNPSCPRCEDFLMHTVKVGHTGGFIGYFCDPCDTFFPSGDWFDIGDSKELVPEHVRNL